MSDVRDTRESFRPEKSPNRVSSTGGMEVLSPQISQSTFADAHPSVSAFANGHLQERAATVFRSYDEGNRNHLDHESMMSALAELGVLNGLTSKQLSEILIFGNDAASRGRTYNFSEFSGCYERLSTYQAKVARADRIKNRVQMPGPPEGAESNAQIKRTFINYCKYTVGQGRLNFDENDPKMSSTQFVKLCQDLGLVQPNGPLNVVTIDIIFHKCKPMGGRRLSLTHYIKALAAAANDSGIGVFDRIQQLATKITLSHVFVAPEPIIFRQETRPLHKLPFPPTSPEPKLPEDHSSEFRNVAGGVRGAVAAAKGRPSNLSPGRPPRGSNAWGSEGALVEAEPPEWLMVLMERIEDLESQLEVVNSRDGGPRPGNGLVGDDPAGLVAAGVSGCTSGEFAALEARVKSCEEADQLLQVGLSDVNKQLPKAATEAVRSSMSSQLGHQLAIKMGDKEVVAALKIAMAELLPSLILEDVASEAVKAAVVEALAQTGRSGTSSASQVADVSQLEALQAKVQAAERVAAQAKKAADAATKQLEAMGNGARTSQSSEDLLKRVIALEARSEAAEKAARDSEAREVQLNQRLAALEYDSISVKGVSSKAKAAPSNGTPNGLSNILEEGTMASRLSGATAERLDSSDHAARLSHLETTVLQLKVEAEASKNPAVNTAVRSFAGLGGASMLRRAGTGNGEASEKVDSLEKKQFADSANVGAALSKLTMRQELIEQKMGSVSTAFAITEAELKARLADLESNSKVLELRLASTRDTMDQMLPNITAQVQSKLSHVGTKEAYEKRFLDMERRVMEGERVHKEYKDAMKLLQNTITSGISSHSGPSAEEARLLVLLQALQSDVQNFQNDYNTAIMYIKGDFEHMQVRLQAIESGHDPRTSSYAPLVELRELENHLMSRMRLLSDNVENQQKAINAVIIDLTEISKKVTGGIDATVLKDIQTQLQMHLDTVYQDIMSQLEAKWATNEALQTSQDKARGNNEAILMALKELDKRNHDSHGTRDEILIRISRQIDYIQNYLRQQDSNFLAPQAGSPVVVQMQPRDSAVSAYQGAAGRRELVSMGSMIRGMLGPSPSFLQRNNDHTLSGGLSPSGDGGKSKRGSATGDIRPLNTTHSIPASILE
ncbi:hypothetical protein CEUSTIGMA_g4909.t1 [Chlamydomonas eustigma]|uniref:EF-hand domain-containing protein n=1 Tax=Chlamydomonas eustigma TaxID=1157962 RepID=A0A250X328_9CHLO|nr:hypothetical protein CEUSTIGMA_g4909.t1 [Chlamydomonas eustigma]|eukprot:GAX77465.1 hypothetical protein CEUSTIGMA_g4909.t1 [Chlamydomonas eustigma]